MKRRDSGSRQERTTAFEQRLLVLFICWAPTSSNISLQQDKLDKILLTFQALSPVPPSPGSLGDHSQLWVGQTWGSLVCQRPLMSKVHWRWYHQWWNNHHVYLVPEHSFIQTRLCIYEVTTPHSPSSQILENTTMISLAGSFPCCYDKMPTKRNLRKEVGSFELSGSHGRKGMVAGEKGSGPHCICLQGTEKWKLVLSLISFSLFILSGTPVR